MQPNDNPQLPISNYPAQTQPQPSKRHSCESQDPFMGNVKRQRTIFDKSPTPDNVCDVAQIPGSSFTLTEILHDSTNADTVESQSSLDPSPGPPDPYDDPYDDHELDQLFESLTGPVSLDKSGMSPHLGNTIDEFALKRSDQDALAELLREES
ncbi:hypothetical protein DER45DRAFT_295953 [Fusarium avenaceum]|nr:hypothetical protein DER45DRAFT_295953 [Fusarium avenaceum]